MKRLQLLFKIAYAFSAITFVLALVCLLGFVVRWCGWSFLAWLSHNAGYVGYGALGSLALCFVTMMKASEAAQELQAEREAAARAAQAEAAAEGDEKA